MASGTLYTYPDNFRALKVLISAKYGGGTVNLAPDFVFGKTNKTPEFLAKFPLGKVPAFESTDGHCVTESNAIAYYVGGGKVKGGTEAEKAVVLEWMSFADSELLPAVCAWTFPFLGVLPLNKNEVEVGKKEVNRLLEVLNRYLLTRTYLAAERVTLADIAVLCTLLPLYQHVLDPSSRKVWKNLERWFTTMVHQPEVLSVVGQLSLCTKEPTSAPPPSTSAPHHKGSGGGGDKKEKKKKESDKKKSNKEEAAVDAGEEAMDAAEEALAAEPKTKDPFAELPKGTFVMDDFKKSYSNEEVEVSIPYFWSKFDKSNYSIWLGEYLYNDELKKTFMSCNLITGMFQRLDKLRKNAFASVCLFGEDNKSSISGIWVWRGHDLAFEMSPDWQIDYGSYKWTKLNPDDDKTRALINNYLAWKGTDTAGLPFNQGKIFK